MAEQAKAERAQLAPEVLAPLAPFRGAEPPAPQWFTDIVAVEPERSFIESLGAKLEVLTWGEVGKPGLLFIHGNSAHADWWSFIAPFFAKDYRVAAFSLAGMGASDWRERYSFPDFAEDFEAVARGAGLYEGGRPPVYIGHSFGGAQVFYAALKHPERMSAVIMVDTGFGPPPEEVAARASREPQVRNIPSADRSTKVYPTLEAALARFRLMPPQPAGNAFVADFIARRSLKRAPLPDGSGDGWTWRFDPNMWAKLDRSGSRPTPEEMLSVKPPVVHIFGRDSAIVQRLRDGRLMMFPPAVREIEIPDAQHHVMIDQPLALVSAIRALLAVWPDRAA
jgi:pimeloyl-ACP methyl ester carboxylesterase